MKIYPYEDNGDVGLEVLAHDEGRPGKAFRNRYLVRTPAGRHFLIAVPLEKGMPEQWLSLSRFSAIFAYRNLPVQVVALEDAFPGYDLNA